ncbi:hypothetical protein, partial [Herpetosiphon llansteffanensis]|uniref:hypothetical protein n=1 Tax=Herpetosiphon llansteffanensis TaxID=2094568 RepID=UPI00196B0397
GWGSVVGGWGSGKVRKQKPHWFIELATGIFPHHNPIEGSVFAVHHPSAGSSMDAVWSRIAIEGVQGD